MLGANSGVLEVLGFFKSQAHHLLCARTELIKMADVVDECVKELLGHDSLLCPVGWIEPGIENPKKHVKRRSSGHGVQIQQRLHLFLEPLTPRRWIES